MGNFIFGVIVGVILATTGASGVAKIIDKGLDTVKASSTELSK